MDGRKKVLIVEDDIIVSNIYRNKLANEGYDVKIAQDGELGKQMVGSFKPDLVLLDLMMPRVNGIEVLKHIRGNRDTKDLPVVVLSNSYLPSMIQEAWSAGASRCLSKSECNPRQLGDVIEKVFKEFGARSAPPPPPAPVQNPVAQPPPPMQNRRQHSMQPGPAPMAMPMQVPMQAPHQMPQHMPQPMPAYYYAPAPAPHLPPQTPEFANTEADLAFQAELQMSFAAGVPQTISLMRAATHQLSKADVEGARLMALSDLYKRVTSLTSNAGLCGLTQLARMSAALEALVKELQGKPGSITASNIRTINHAVDLLVVMMNHRGDPERFATKLPTVLVVDDEAISRRAILYALEKAQINAIGIEDPQTTTMLLSDNHFDMIFLDVDMPGMTGFELCSKIRALPDHQKTPIVFVTALTDFESRARSTLSGGNDLIAKPFIFLELTVKALTFILRAQLNQ